jgi:type III pantothenate kinase
MLLCDIGNTSYYFYDGSSTQRYDIHDFVPEEITKQVCYINVNANVHQRLKELENWMDLGLHVRRDAYYETMGIDRIMACEAVEEGVVMDAGSAITVDVMQQGIYQGGFIYPGVKAMHNAYAALSSRLEYAFNFDIDLGKMPKNSQDAITYGFLATLKAAVMRFDAPLILTGGDASLLAPHFPDAVIDELLLFKGMQKIIDKGHLC